MKHHRNLGRPWITSTLVFALCVLPAPAVVAQHSVEMTITGPASGETVHDNQGNVRVTVSAPRLPDGTGAAFRPLVDGAPHGPDRRTPSFILENIDRGEHVLQVLLVDGKGEVVAASRPLSFHVWRASALFPGRKDQPAARPVP